MPPAPMMTMGLGCAGAGQSWAKLSIMVHFMASWRPEDVFAIHHGLAVLVLRFADLDHLPVGRALGVVLDLRPIVTVVRIVSPA
jgi:hypothetical protein